MKVVNVECYCYADTVPHKISSRSLCAYYVMDRNTINNIDCKPTKRNSVSIRSVVVSVWFVSYGYFESLCVIHGKSHLLSDADLFAYLFLHSVLLCSNHCEAKVIFCHISKSTWKWDFFGKCAHEYTYQQSLYSVPVGICYRSLIPSPLLFSFSFPFSISLRFHILLVSRIAPPYVVWLLNDDVFARQINFKGFYGNNNNAVC